VGNMKEKRPCDEVIAEVKEFLDDCGWGEIMYWKDSKQIDAIIARETAETDLTYHIVIDFVGNRVFLEVYVGDKEEEEDYQMESWKTIPDLYDTIIAMMEHYGIFQGLPPKEKWKKLKLI